MASSRKHPRPPTRGDPESELELNPTPWHKRSRTTYRPTMTIDWRGVICRFLDRPGDLTDNEILGELETVSTELVKLRQLSSRTLTEPKPPDYEVIHRVRCQESDNERLYLDVPWVVDSGLCNAHLRGSNEINNFELHMERKKEMTFFVFREYECCNQDRIRASSNLQPKDLLVEEYVSNISDEFRLALRELCDLALEETACPNFADDEANKIHQPYLWWFHGRSKIKNEEVHIRADSRLHLEVFQRYLDTCLRDEWATVDQLLSTGHITAAYMHYLFVPQEICISNTQGQSTSLLEAFTSIGWLELPRRYISGTKWTFDGNFQKETLRVIVNPPTSLTKFPIRHLSIYPARFAKKSDIMAIRERGKMFWKCRHRNYVCYKGNELDWGYNSPNSRFMVDTTTFKQLRPPRREVGHVPNKDELGPEIMSQDDPSLSDKFFMCLPTTLAGYNMQKKIWVTLHVGLIEDVTWNEEAFQLLVIDESTKDLVQAIVMNQLQAEEHADVIHGKGNGLFILLHGGPGTGKTLTAESVAEVARRPLYKVSCGDIGTKAEEVEKYLETVLHLGKRWGCVVLLDEADVFLEQRTLSNLERNALVSVFLRALEYYDGILILTTNRVGIFDEAFRSRIQLTLRYQNLNQNQRQTIWENFILRLEKRESSKLPATSSSSSTPVVSSFGFDFEDIKMHIAKLAKHSLNGREIRNAISTARQLAMYKNEPLAYKHLERVIKETNKFEEYLTDLNRGLSIDEIRNDKGER
ncbi:ATPase [Xylaria cf. heliscus]|nr:ATPase [Xylaria cf. heliscus]